MVNERWRGAGAVERGGLENRCARKRTEGSNPSLSATRPSAISQISKKNNGLGRVRFRPLSPLTAIVHSRMMGWTGAKTIGSGR